MQSPFSPFPVSAEIQAFASGFPVLVLHAGVTLGLLAAGSAIYATLSPWKEIARIRNGAMASAVAFGSAILGLAVPLAVSLSVSSSTADIALWGAAAITLQLLVYRLIDFLLDGLPQRVADGEMSAAVLLAAARTATALVVAAALTG